MKSLFVKCPECGFYNDLGFKAIETYCSSFAFMLNRTCSKCGLLFTEADTWESDYEIRQPSQWGQIGEKNETTKST